jgi:signal transduction histidine kinase/ligand-binding sensor domain-containing protein/DNA-binding response OmpR family regulator
MRILFTSVLFLLSSFLYCQTEEIYFHSIRKGLSNQFVRCIYKDSRGFIWFGTQNGLTRYDGVNFLTYENSQNDSTSLSYNNVTSVFEDKQKNLWVGTFGGLNLYNREKDNFKRISVLKKTVISVICEDMNHQLWVGTIGAGLKKYDPERATIESFGKISKTIDSLNANHVTSLVVDQKNRLWVGTWDGLFLMDTKGRTLMHFMKGPDISKSLSDDFVNTLSLENDSVLWIGTLYGGLNKLIFHNREFHFKHYLSATASYKPPSILTTISDKHGYLWAGTENNGLLRLNPNTEKVDHYQCEEGNPYTLSSNLVRKLYIDDLDILWVGTIGKGVNFVDKRYKHFEVYQKNPQSKNSLCGNDVRDFAEDKNYNIWVATYNGICRFNPFNQQFTGIIDQRNGLTTNAVNSITFDRDGNLWVGTLDKGIDRFNEHHVKTGHFDINGIQEAGENKLNTLYVDKEANLWAGTSGSGLYKYDKAGNKFVEIIDKETDITSKGLGYVFSILETSDRKIWVATAYRLFCLQQVGNNEYKIRTYTNGNAPGDIHSNYLVSLLEDKHNNLWIGSLDQGLFLYHRNTDSFTSYTVDDGLPSNSICGILEDKQGKLWISTTKGLVRFDVAKNQFACYKTEDGLISDEFNSVSCLKSSSGKLFFGTSEGFNCFFPDRIKNSTAVQPVCLTGFKLFNQSVRVGAKGSPLSKSIGDTRKIVLKYNQSSFTIEFVALNYIQGSKSQYKYILEGLENRWNNAGNTNSATYSYVKPGKYIFKVQGSNNDGVWNEEPATLEIVVQPPWWKSKVALVFYLLVFIVILYGIINYRIAIAKQAHLAELNRMKMQFLANVSHELRTPLSLILAPVENLFAQATKDKEIRNQLEIIYKNANRLFRLVNELMDFSKAEENKLSLSVQKGDIVRFTRELSNYFRDEALRRQINYQFESVPDSIEAWFDAEKYEKIILNVLSNAFKFTPDNGTISIRMEQVNTDVLPEFRNPGLFPKLNSKDFLKISIADNGKEIPVEDLSKIFERFYQGNNENYTHQVGTGIGLSLTKMLVELHYGRIVARSEKGKETCFTIFMPLGDSHFKKNEISKEPIDIVMKYNEHPEIPEETIDKKAHLSPNTPSVLIIEDNFDLRKYISATLAARYKITEAGDGDSGYQLAIENVPDLIVSDIIMPGLSGIELCKQLKGNIITSHIPIVLLTAKATLEDKIDGIETGADAYLTKPFNVKHLEAVIRNLIDTRKKLFKRFSQEAYILPKEISSNALDQDFLERIIKYVEENINVTDISVEDLAAYLLMSPGHTWRKVKSLTGLPTNEFIRVIRLKKAVKIMEESNLSISEIAYKVGFSSPAYFTKCFGKQYGTSPSSFLNKNIR